MFETETFFDVFFPYQKNPGGDKWQATMTEQSGPRCFNASRAKSWPYSIALQVSQDFWQQQQQQRQAQQQQQHNDPTPTFLDHFGRNHRSAGCSK